MFFTQNNHLNSCYNKSIKNPFYFVLKTPFFEGFLPKPSFVKAFWPEANICFGVLLFDLYSAMYARG